MEVPFFSLPFRPDVTSDEDAAEINGSERQQGRAAHTSLITGCFNQSRGYNQCGQMKNKGVKLEVWDPVHFQEYAHLSTTLLASPLPLGRRWPVLSHTGVLPPGGRQTAGSSADRHMVSAVMNLRRVFLPSEFDPLISVSLIRVMARKKKKTVLTFINTFISCERSDHYLLLLLLHVFGSDHDRRVRKGRVVTSQPTSTGTQLH